MSGGDDDKKHYKIGYRKPPKETQFQPGESGRSRARSVTSQHHLRPRVKRDLDDVVRSTGAKKVKVRDGDTLRETTMADIAVEKLFDAAFRSGKVRDIMPVVLLLAKAGAFGDRQMTQREMIASLTSEEIVLIDHLREELGKYLPDDPTDDERARGEAEGYDRTADTVQLEQDDVEEERRPPDG